MCEVREDGVAHEMYTNKSTNDTCLVAAHALPLSETFADGELGCGVLETGDGVEVQVRVGSGAVLLAEGPVRGCLV